MASRTTGPRNANKRKKPEINIREMEIDDISPVYHLGEKLFTSDEFPMLYRTWDPYELTSFFTTDSEYSLVADAGGEVVGFVLATIIEKEGTAWNKYGYLSWIGVDERFQGTGLGLRLYKRIEERLRREGVRMIIVDTVADNTEALAFFAAMGFSVSSQQVWLAKTLRRPKAAQTRPPTSPGTARSRHAR